MINSLLSIFDSSGFPPGWDCGPAWQDQPWVGWAHIVADISTFLAYYAAPLVVAWFVVQRKDLKFPPSFWTFFGLIFFSCGSVHLIEAGIFWWPQYKVSALLKILTATVSCAGVFVLAKSLPKALDLKPPEVPAQEIAVREATERKLGLRITTAEYAACLSARGDVCS